MTQKMQPSDEADRKQLQIARKDGDAYQEALQYMVNEVAHTGATQRAGDYTVGYAQEEAEGMYALLSEGNLEWQEPAPGDNCHLEISVSDAADGRFIPALKIHATLTKQDGQRVGPFEVPFLWHPGLYHYGLDLQVPGDGHYTLNVKIEPPTFKRHDKKNGQRYAETVEVEFGDVNIKTGRE